MTPGTDAGDLVPALRQAGIGEIDASPRRRAEYSSDASNYRVVPAVVVFPRHSDEVLAALHVCRETGAALTARGAGTSVAGNAIGPGVVLDFSRHLNAVLTVDPGAGTATVQPGAILDDITTAARPHGLRFGPDPSTHSRATIGGSLGNNACGSRALTYGRCADNAIELDVVTGTGHRFTARRYGRAGLHGAGVPEAAALDAMIRGRLELIRTEFGRFTRQVSGYSLEHLLPERGADLARFLVGTEGTLAVVLQATVALTAEPAATALAVLGYTDIAAAAEAAPALLPHRPVALEGMDARLVEVVRGRAAPAAMPGLPRGGGWLLAEVSGANPAEARAAAVKLIAEAGCLDSVVVTGAAARALWRIREDGAGLGGRTPAGRPAWPGWEDSAVPPGELGPYLRELTALMTARGVDGLMYGHFGDGCIHARFDFPLRTDPGAFRAFAEDAADLAAAHGGSMSGEHGDGRARSALLPRMYSPEAIGLFADVKRTFDPQDILNPGVLVRPSPIDASLRLPAARPMTTGLGQAYSKDGGDFAAAVHRCVGVGKCRADMTASGGVMCPSFLATRDEKDSTRGRARVLQELANGGLLARGWSAPEVAEALDLCLSCKGCSRDCPAGVDMASYKAEALYQRYRRRARPPSHYALGWLPRWARLAAHAPGLANAALRAGLLARGVKRLGGIDQRRPLPRFARQTFRDWFAGHRMAAGIPVLLWADTFTNHFAPQIGQAAVRVLEDAGYSVRITDQPVCCGLTWISTGQLDAARRQLLRSLDALTPALDAGMPIVGLEPSCTAVLRGDLTELLRADPRSRRAAAATRTLAELLTSTDSWRPPDLSTVAGLAQPHCHQRAVCGWDADAALLRDAGASITPVGGCCGLAGNFGMERGHYEVSVAVAETALLPAVRSAAADAVILADGFSCRTQLGHLTHRSGHHLAELLSGHLRDHGPPGKDEHGPSR